MAIWLHYIYTNKKKSLQYVLFNYKQFQWDLIHESYNYSI